MNTLGSLLAQALSGGWRPRPPSTPLTTQEWARAAPALHATAAGGLGWWKLRGSSLEATPVARAFRDAFRVQSLHARLQERGLDRALGLLRSAGVRPILAKGWAVARRYPRPGLRPYGDLDLHVAPEEHAAALAVLADHRGEGLVVDLHSGVPRLGRSWADVAARSVDVGLGATRVAIPGQEDHLALLCGHFLVHGAWRPLWLCDVALLLEEAAADFDWDHLGSLPARQVEEVRLVALLAHRLLDARLDRTPWEVDEPLPSWLPRAVLEAWGRGGHYSLTTRIAFIEADPRRFLEALRVRWPNPVEATVRWRAPYNAFPRLPYQILDAAVRGARALWEAPGVIARRPRAPSGPEEPTGAG